MIILFTAYASIVPSGGSFASRRIFSYISQYSNQCIKKFLFIDLFKFNDLLDSNIFIFDGLFNFSLILLPLLYFRYRPVRILVFCRGCIFPQSTHFYVSHSIVKTFILYLLRVYRYLFENITFILSSHLEYARLSQVKLAQSQDSVIYDSLDINSLLSSNQPCLVSHLVPKTRRLRICFFSGLQTAKNYPFVIDLVNCLSNFYIFNHIEFIIVGSGPPNILAKFPNISFMESLPHSSLLELLASSDITLVPSIYESYCYLVIECIVNSCFVLVSDQAPWNILNNTDLGFSLPLNVQIWAQSILSYSLNLSSFSDRPLFLERLNQRHSVEQWLSRLAKTCPQLSIQL